MNATPLDESDAGTFLDAMRLLIHQPQLSQRELSKQLGLSLGKTHYVLHALLDRGLLKVSNFRRSNQKTAYAYLLTPKGMREKIRLTRRFLALKEEEFEALQREIAELRNDLHHPLP
jgi:EPS-associated MarR family transcriptional regulator